jgi:hypothetical protein
MRLCCRWMRWSWCRIAVTSWDAVPAARLPRPPGVQVAVRGGDQGGVVCLGHGPAGPALSSQPATIRIPHRTGLNPAVPPATQGAPTGDQSETSTFQAL